jgi:hypothetical protein
VLLFLRFKVSVRVRIIVRAWSRLSNRNRVKVCLELAIGLESRLSLC